MSKWAKVTKQSARDNRYVSKGGRMSAKRRSNKGATSNYEGIMRNGETLKHQSYKRTAVTYGATGAVIGGIAGRYIGGSWHDGATAGAAYGIGSAIGGVAGAHSWKKGMGDRRLKLEKNRSDSVFKKSKPYQKVPRGSKGKRGY